MTSEAERRNLVLIRGGGDLASGVAFRLFRARFRVVITEIAVPLSVRRLVSFSEAVYDGAAEVEGVQSQLANRFEQVEEIFQRGEIPVFVDPHADIRKKLNPDVLIDARMIKRPPELGLEAAKFIIGLGPGFVPGENCHAAIETMRGHSLGRVLWDTPPIPDTGLPGSIQRHGENRVLRAPETGLLRLEAAIGSQVQEGTVIARVNDFPVYAAFDGVIRGLLRPGIQVTEGMKIGDLDPRNDPSFCALVSDKALAVGGGVLEAILSTDRRG